MEQQLRAALKWVALGCEVVVALCVAAGGLEALWRLALNAGFRSPRQMTDVWRRFAAWIVLALEFALAGDIVSTAVAPTWTSIGQLAAIATIRTGLSYFLERDLQKLVSAEPPATTQGR
jgi:uncharacterized membrane protein